MTEDNCPRVSSTESMASTDSSTTKQRKKRKWDQPAESLVSAGVSVPGILPLGNVGTLVGIGLPGVAPVSGALLMNPLTACSTTVPQVFQVPSIQLHTATVVQKINQAKIQDELIAREIVINDAEPTIRYKLTKRQTQEEIQKCTGAVVITRGKYRPPNAPPDGEKPLYLHISAGAHLKDTVERIKAVDLAAAMVEEMLKPGSLNNGVKVTQTLSTCVFLGFEADPSLNITARIRGPNEQLSYYEDVVLEILGVHKLKKDNNNCIYSCLVIIPKVLKVQSFWLKISWIQSAKSVVSPGSHQVRSTVLFHHHSNCWLESKVLGMSLKQILVQLPIQHHLLWALYQFHQLLRLHSLVSPLSFLRQWYHNLWDC